jgi:hypothetical protein
MRVSQHEDLDHGRSLQGLADLLQGCHRDAPAVAAVGVFALSLPAVAIDEPGSDAERFFGDYLATYLERDVRSIFGVRSLRDFDRFMRLCAARTGLRPAAGFTERGGAITALPSRAAR